MYRVTFGKNMKQMSLTLKLIIFSPKFQWGFLLVGFFVSWLICFLGRGIVFMKVNAAPASNKQIRNVLFWLRDVEARKCLGGKRIWRCTEFSNYWYLIFWNNIFFTGLSSSKILLNSSGLFYNVQLQHFNQVRIVLTF